MQRLVIYIVVIELMIIFNSCTSSYNQILLQRPVYANSINYDYGAYLRYINVRSFYTAIADFNKSLMYYESADTFYLR